MRTRNMAFAPSASSTIAKNHDDTLRSRTRPCPLGQRLARRVDVAVHRVGHNGTMESLKGKFADQVRLGEVRHQSLYALRNEDLSTGGLAAQPGGKIGHGPDCAVITASLEPDGANRCVALRH